MQSSSQANTQQCEETGGETKSNAAAAGLSFAPLPGFSAEQTSSIFSLFSQVFNQQLVQQPNPTPTPPPTQPSSLAKKKAQSQAQRVTTVQVQEVDRMQEMEHLGVQISVENEAGKHVVLPWDYVATSPWHAVISYVGMALFDGMIMVQNGAIWRPRIGVG